MVNALKNAWSFLFQEDLDSNEDPTSTLYRGKKIDTMVILNQLQKFIVLLSLPHATWWRVTDTVDCFHFY